jgi:putative hydrolase of the HAD superfamily
MPQPTHVFFDFFGTLVTYVPGARGDDHHASHRVLTDAGCEITYEEYLAAWTRTFDEAESAASASLDEFSMDQACARFLAGALPTGAGGNAIEGFRDAYLEEWSRGVMPIAGLREMLDELASPCGCSVVSNTHHAPLVHGLLRRVGLADAFSAVVTSVEHGRRKPCRTIYEHALAMAGCAPGDALFVGDSYGPDYVGPRAVGVRALLIDPERRAPVPAAHRLVSVLDLRAWIGDTSPGGAS